MLINLEEYAELHGVSFSSVRSAISRGTLSPDKKIGNRWYIDSEKPWISKSKTHGLSNSRIYNVWNCMRQRCSNPKNSHYSAYGGRGISVCPEWQNSFESFYAWAINNGYKDTLEIDRINNDGNYEPSNCRWVTRKENVAYRVANHKRRVALRDVQNDLWIREHEEILRKYVKKYRQESP